ncbi:Winged helix-turn-helix [Candidatus Methanoperedenaceae archaeon GB50]|nr:MAG: hypothetical protein DRN85_08465 [Methanosarcinales archaeon]CAD7768103.1 MAG: Winged helix-turn-helix [Candidatus Methanoperedenaceae archaeon GB50]CAD7776345.1 Winged helix-turn-helix [Candidatus Methanoperedenaceae archaeon GB50]
MKRSRLEIMLSILKAAENGANKAKVVRNANLNFAAASKYLDFLSEGGFISLDKDIYTTTKKGLEYIEKLEEISIKEF